MSANCQRLSLTARYQSLLVSNLVLFPDRVELVADEVPLAEEFCKEREKEGG